MEPAAHLSFMTLFVQPPPLTERGLLAMIHAEYGQKTAEECAWKYIMPVIFGSSQ